MIKYSGLMDNGKYSFIR